MVKWTEEERCIVRAVWEKIDIEEIGPQVLARVLIVYPWTERYFGSFGDLFTTTAVLNNPKVASHGTVLLKALDKGVKNIDNIKETYAALSKYHYENLNVDPVNFRLMADSIIITIACKLKSTMSPQVQATWQKFMYAVVEAMNSQYK